MRNAPLPAVIGVAAGLKDIVKADEVRLNVHVRVVDGIAHAGLGREVHNDVRRIVRKEPVQNGPVRHVAAHEAEAAAVARPLGGEAFQQPEAVLLERDLVVIVHAVDADDVDVFIAAQQFQR